MEIPLVIFYYIYLGLVAIFILFSFFNLYHLLVYGSLNFTTAIITIAYMLATVAILFISWRYISPINWGQAVDLMPTDPNSFNLF